MSNIIYIVSIMKKLLLTLSALCIATTVYASEVAPDSDIILTQTRSIFNSIVGDVPFKKESLVNFLEKGASWLTYQKSGFHETAAEKILMLDEIESKHSSLIPVYSGSSYYINALNDLFTALHLRINKMPETTDQYAFRSPEYFQSPFGPKEILDLHAKFGDSEFDRHPQFINHAMCVTFSLLSTIECACESTLAFWSGGDSYAVDEKQISTLVDSYITSITGCPLPLNEIKQKTMDLLVATPKTGVLYQFFIHPNAVDDALLVTRAWGVPLKTVYDYSSTKPTLEFMRDVRKQPDGIIKYMSAHADSFKETCSVWRRLASKAESKIDPTLPSLADESYPLADVTIPRVQGRLIVDPKATMDHEKFTIKKHYWEPVSEEELAKSKRALDSFVDWIMEARRMQVQEIIEGLSKPVNSWNCNPYTGEEFLDKESALISLRQKLS